MHTLICIRNGGYLDAEESVLRDGATVQTWSSSGAGKRNQQWHLRSVGNGVVNLINMRNCGYLDVDEPSNTNGAHVQTWGSEASGKPNQQWRLRHIGGDVYNLINVQNGGYLDADENGATNGAIVRTWRSSGNGKPNQQWHLTEHAVQIDIWEAFRAFAVNFPGKVKMHTKGCLILGGRVLMEACPSRVRQEIDWGILFHTEFLINNKLWLYEAFPKSDTLTFPAGYQHVWNGMILEQDGYISADCTIPFKQQGALWTPPIPRVHRHHHVGPQKITKSSNVSDTQIAHPDNRIISQTTNPAFGTVYSPTIIDLSDHRSQENMGRRWVLTVGLYTGPERWSVDIGPEVGIFQPRYGIVGYHADWDDERYFANIQAMKVENDRRHDGTPQQA